MLQSQLLLSRTIKYKKSVQVRCQTTPWILLIQSTWNPHYNKDRFLLERIKIALYGCFLTSDHYHMITRLQQLRLWSLEERRNRADLIELFKVIKGLSSTLWYFFKKAEDTSTRGHTWKSMKRHSHCDTRLYFFSQRVINRWNNLLQEDVDAESISGFKSRLEKRHAVRQMDFF